MNTFWVTKEVIRQANIYFLGMSCGLNEVYATCILHKPSQYMTVSFSFTTWTRWDAWCLSFPLCKVIASPELLGHITSEENENIREIM